MSSGIIAIGLSYNNWQWLVCLTKLIASLTYCMNLEAEVTPD